MSKKLYEETNIQDIADAIRVKNGTQNQYTVAQMGNAVRAITTQPNLETLNATENGNYLPSAGKDGFSSVSVSVSGAASVIQPLSATQNGTYNPPSGVDGYAPVTVNVSGGGGEQPFVGGFGRSSNSGDSVSPVIKNRRIVKNFSASYPLIPADENNAWLDVDWSETWEIGCAFKVTDLTGNFALFGVCSNATSFSAAPSVEYMASEHNIGFGISTNKTNAWTMFNIIKENVIADTWYFIKCGFNLNTMKVYADITEDFINWEHHEYELEQTPIHNNSSRLGFGGLVKNNSHVSAFGMIDLFNTYIKVNGTMLFGAYSESFPI